MCDFVLHASTVCVSLYLVVQFSVLEKVFTPAGFVQVQTDPTGNFGDPCAIYGYWLFSDIMVQWIMEVPHGHNFFSSSCFSSLSCPTLPLLLLFSCFCRAPANLTAMAQKRWASCSHAFCDASPVKWETVLISSCARFGTTQFPTVSQQSWDFGSWCIACLISNRHTTPLLHLRKSIAIPTKPLEKYCS